MDLHADIEIARDAADVFAYVSDFENNPTWQGGMQHARFTTEPPLRVGSTYEQVARFLGRDIVSIFEITALEPGRSVSIATLESTFPIRVTRRVEPLGPGRCRVIAEISGDPLPWFLSPLSGLMRWFGQRSVTQDYARLQALLEGDAAPTS